MGEDESFDSFYSKLNEVINSKFNLGEKMEDSKVVKKNSSFFTEELPCKGDYN